MNYRYRNYEEMKDSGVEWLDVIPKSWTRNKLKRELKFSVGSTPSTSNRSFFEGENIWVTIGDLNCKYCSESKTKLTEEALRSANMKRVPKGSLLYSFKLSVGQVAFTERDLYTNEAIASFSPNNNSNLDFWYYALGNYLIENSNENIYGAKLLNQELINNASIFIPSEEEQKKIAKFLDEKTAQFDSIISKKEALIEKLEETKKSLISEVVTGKVKIVKTSGGYELVERKKEEMKESGVEWLGDIPKEWDVKAVKYLFSLRNERNYKEMKEVQLLSLFTNLGVLKQGEVEARGNKVRTVEDYKEVYPNDIIVNIILAWMGAIGMSEYRGVISPAYDIYKPINDKIISKFYHYVFRTGRFSGECYKKGRGIMDMRWRTYSDEFKSILVPVPSVAEKILIVEFIDYKNENIDILINKTKQQIEKLKEAKQSLISEAVTGKIEILD